MEKKLAVIIALFCIVPVFGQNSERLDPDRASAHVRDSDDFHPTTAVTDQATRASAHFERNIASWRDPLTAPHTRTECCKVEEIDHTGVKVCTRYCTDCQWMYVDAWLVVDISSPADISTAIRECHDQAAAAGLVSGIVTAALGGGGTALDAAAKAYTSYFTACLASKIQQDIVSVRIDFRSHWGGWEGC